jgi:hypothetical protein
MGRNLRLENEHWNRVDHGRYGPGDEASLRLGTALLRLLLGLLLALLHLLLARAGLAALRLAGQCSGAGHYGHQDREDELPLHAAHVTTPRLNRK